MSTARARWPSTQRPRLPPEARFLILSLREPDAAPTAAVRSATADVADWSATAALAAGHGLSAYVLQAIDRHALRVPADAAALVRDDALLARARVLQLNAALPDVTGEFAASGIPLLVLKGPALAPSIYPQPALRPYVDVDLTVQPQHEAAAVALLCRRAFSEIPCGHEEARRARAGHIREGAAFHRVFISQDGRALFELHTDPLQLGLAPRCEAARWRRAQPVPHLSGALMLAPEDQLVHLSVHAHKHGFSRLIWLKDVDLLLRAYRDRLDWELVLSVARLEGVQASVWYCLRLARQVCATPVPSSTLRRFAPASPAQLLYALVWPPAGIVGLHGHMRRRAVQFLAADSWRGMLPSLVLMGRRRDRVRAVAQAVLPR